MNIPLHCPCTLQSCAICCLPFSLFGVLTLLYIAVLCTTSSPLIEIPTAHKTHAGIAGFASAGIYGVVFILSLIYVLVKWMNASADRAPKLKLTPDEPRPLKMAVSGNSLVDIEAKNLIDMSYANRNRPSAITEPSVQSRLVDGDGPEDHISTGPQSLGGRSSTSNGSTSSSLS